MFTYSLIFTISEPTQWNHYHPETWEGLCATGQAQSPIDLETRETSGLVFDDFGFDQLSQWHYGGTIENNGNTIKFTPNQEITIKSRLILIYQFNIIIIIISVSGLNDQYKLSQLFFHWGYTSQVGSEHTIEGKVAFALVFFSISIPIICRLIQWSYNS